MYIVLIGAPGAGKGTQAAEMSFRLGLAHIATGDMFREALQQQTFLGLQAKQYMDRGELVPDEVTVAMVVERLQRPDCANGAILDGFPRTVAQARALDAALAERQLQVDQALYLAVDDEELLRRLGGRWLCRKCQASYHIASNPPKVPGVCDRCGGELYQRDDDNVETAKRRLSVYFEQTTPVIDYYQAHGVLDEVDGQLAIAEVADAIFDAVARRQRANPKTAAGI